MSVAPADLTSTNAVTTDLIYDWNEVKRRGKVFPKKVELCDETLRDGIQSPSVVDPSIETKHRRRPSTACSVM